MFKPKSFVIAALFFFLPYSIKASAQSINDRYPYAALYYYGVTVTDSLLHIWAANRWPEHIQSLELAYTLSPENSFRRAFKPLDGVVQIAGNDAIRFDRGHQRFYEFDPYIPFRWTNFPWNHVFPTSLAIGEGISYVTRVPSLEKRHNCETKRLLNYLVLEATFSLVRYPQVQLVARIHHRSGAFGLYRAENAGSNDVGLGIRYLFN